ncbi:hypothetical protein FI667_g7510, partial [Globisporangium splendens]
MLLEQSQILMTHNMATLSIAFDLHNHLDELNIEKYDRVQFVEAIELLKHESHDFFIPEFKVHFQRVVHVAEESMQPSWQRATTNRSICISSGITAISCLLVDLLDLKVVNARCTLDQVIDLLDRHVTATSE